MARSGAGTGRLDLRFDLLRRRGVPRSPPPVQEVFVEVGYGQALPVLRIRLLAVHAVCRVDPVEAESDQSSGDRRSAAPMAANDEDPRPGRHGRHGWVSVPSD